MHPGMVDPPATADGNPRIALLELSGLSYHKRKSDTSSRGRIPTKADAEIRPVAAALNPALVVVWHVQNDETIDTEATPTYLRSSPLLEESMDDEGNVFSWSCAWPDASLIPLGRGSKSQCTIPLGVGLQLPGMNEIQPLGVATVTIPEEHSESDILLSVDVSKPKSRRIGKRIGKFKEFEYTVTPSTALKVKWITPVDKKSSKAITDPLINKTEFSNASTPKQAENNRGLLPVATDAKSVVSEKSNTPLAILMWGSQCQDDEEHSFTVSERVRLSKMKQVVSASGSTTTAPVTSTSGNNRDFVSVAVPTDAVSVISESSASPPLALLMWGSQCQDDKCDGNTKHSDGAGVDNPQPTLRSSLSTVSPENICLAYALMEELEKLGQEKLHEQQPLVSKMANIDTNENRSDNDSTAPRYEKHNASRDREGTTLESRPVALKRSTQTNSQLLPDFLNIIKQKINFCNKKVEEAIDNVTCGDLFDELIGEDVERNVKKAHDSWNCSFKSAKNYLDQIYEFSKAVSFGSTQCSDDGSDTSFSSESTEAERKTERLIALLRRRSAKRSNDSSRHRVERRFIRLPLANSQIKSAYRFNRNVSVCSV